MNASNFATFSTGIGTTGFVRTHKYLHDHPKVFYRMQSALLSQLPKNEAREKEDKPAYVTDVKFTMSSSIILESMCPKISELNAADAGYKYRMYHAAHGLDRFLDEALESWNEYQECWANQGGTTHEYIPYPYTRQII